VAGRLPETERGRVIARDLVARGLLTRFQAEQLLAGRTGGFVVGPYRILEQLGQGGMGRVFKAEHRLLGRTVALKVLSPRLLRSGKARQFFLREVRAAARLSHPHIVTAFDASRAGDRYYLVMEYVAGPNLDQLVRGRGPLPVGQACEFVRQVADALHYAGGRGMVHRDVKPANILVKAPAADGADPGVVKISDFGLARLQEAGADGDDLGTIATESNTVMGTPDYIAPEQARNLHSADARSDLYGLGCTFYFLLTGRVPFPGGSTLEKLLRHTAEEAVPVEQLRPEVPPGVAAVVRRLMAKDPAARFPSPAELIAALEPFCVRAPLPWSVPPPVAVGDSLPTPAEGCLGDDPGAEPAAEDEESALACTLASTGGSTPVVTSPLPALPRAHAVHDPRAARRWKLALLWATAIVGGVLAAAAGVSWLLSGG
jgi:serine/threonine-protein kinase